MKELYIYYFYNYYSILFFLIMFSGLSIFSSVHILLDYERLSKTFIKVVITVLIVGIITTLGVIFLPNTTYIKYLLSTYYGVIIK